MRKMPDCAKTGVAERRAVATRSDLDRDRVIVPPHFFELEPLLQAELFRVDDHLGPLTVTNDKSRNYGLKKFDA
jgi:hypothetical protein